MNKFRFISMTFQVQTNQSIDPKMVTNIDRYKATHIIRKAMHVFIVLCLFGKLTFAQNLLALGEWTTHLPFNSATQVAVSKGFTYYATENAILKVNHADFSLEKLTKTSGLSDSKIQKIYFHQASSSLIIAYNSSLIDIISPRGKIVISDIVNFVNIPVSKTINSFNNAGDSHVFVSTDYGYSLLNVLTGRFDYTLFSKNVKYYSMAFSDNYLYAASADGVYRFNTKTTQIPQDFSAWQLLGSDEGLPEREFTHVASHFNSIYAATKSELYKLDVDGRFKSVFQDPNYRIQYLSNEAQHLLVGLQCVNSCRNKILKWNEDDLYDTVESECTEKNIHTVESQDGTLWMADIRWGFRFLQASKTSCDVVYSNGPLTTNFFEILPNADGVYVSSGGYNETYTPIYRGDGIFKFQNNNWTEINSSSVPLFETEKIHDMLRLLPHPDGNIIYMSSYGRGLLEYNIAEKTFKHFDERNSKLGTSVGDPTRVRVSGLSYQKSKKTLWASVFLAKEPIASYDGNVWKSYAIPGAGTELIEIKVDQNGYKWIIPRGGSGIWVWDEKNPDDPTDDRSILLNSSNTVMTSSKVNCVEIDEDGDVWIGTLNGPVVFECGGDQIFSGQCKGSQRKVDQNGIIDLLLRTEDVNCIAVDGGNRKWFGTKNGVYVMNASADVQVHLFTTKNSPLMSDNILDIAIDPKNGDAWIGTESGLQVYRSEAIAAKDNFTETPLVFPNPVEPGYDGPIAIKGLARDARVKITDISGKLVFEAISVGGQLIWDGKDYKARAVKSGTYLVFANTTKDFEKSEAALTKIVIVR